MVRDNLIRLRALCRDYRVLYLRIIRVSEQIKTSLVLKSFLYFKVYYYFRYIRSSEQRNYIFGLCIKKIQHPVKVPHPLRFFYYCFGSNKRFVCEDRRWWRNIYIYKCFCKSSFGDFLTVSAPLLQVYREINSLRRIDLPNYII